MLKYNKNGKLIYLEKSCEPGKIREYDENNNLIYSEDSTEYWIKRLYDKNNNLRRIYYDSLQRNRKWEMF